MKSNESLVSEIQSGLSVTENLQTLYQQNLPLIKKFIRPYTVFEDEADLLQESYFGLSRAVQHYDNSKDASFMTFARYWVVQHIQRHIQKTAAIPIPAYLSEKIVRYKKTVQQFAQLYGTEPTDSEISGFMGVSVTEVQKIQQYAYGLNVESLDRPLPDNEDFSIADTVPDDFDLENSVIGGLYADFTAGILDAAVSGLDEKQRLIIRKIYFEGQSIADVARESGMPYRTVRELKHQALRKLSMNRQLRERLEITDASIYNSGLRSFRLHNDSSVVERIALKRIEIESLLDK